MSQMQFADLSLFLKAILLGIVEGATEFIPVSSTAHLIIASQIINFHDVANKTFEITIQIGAIFAVIFYYRIKLWQIIVNFRQKAQLDLITKVIIGFMPAVFIGLFLHSIIKQLLNNNFVILIALFLGGVAIILVEKICHNKNSKQEQDSFVAGGDNLSNISKKQALAIGFLQCLAMIPGVSRSAATIIGGVAIGLKRREATEFSFLLAIPTIGAATLFDLMKNYQLIKFSDIGLLAIGIITAFFSSLVVIKWLIKFVSNNSFIIFGIYRIIVAIIGYFILKSI